MLQEGEEQVDAEQEENKNKEMEDILEKIIEELWANYDKDNSGQLSKAEAQLLFKDSLDRIGEKEITEEQMNKAFDTFDQDGSGNISKAEMKSFFKKIIDENKLQ